MLDQFLEIIDTPARETDVLRMLGQSLVEHKKYAPAVKVLESLAAEGT